MCTQRASEGVPLVSLTNSMYQPDGTRPAPAGIVTRTESASRVKVRAIERCSMSVTWVTAAGRRRLAVAILAGSETPNCPDSPGELLRAAGDHGTSPVVEVRRRVDLDRFLEVAGAGVGLVAKQRVASKRHDAAVRQEQGLGVVVAPHGGTREARQLVRRGIEGVAFEDVTGMLAAVVARTAGDDHLSVRCDHDLRVAGRLGQAARRREMGRRGVQVRDIEAAR